MFPSLIPAVSTPQNTLRTPEACEAIASLPAYPYSDEKGTISQDPRNPGNAALETALKLAGGRGWLRSRVMALHAMSDAGLEAMKASAEKFSQKFPRGRALVKSMRDLLHLRRLVGAREGGVVYEDVVWSTLHVPAFLVLCPKGTGHVPKYGMSDDEVDTPTVLTLAGQRLKVVVPEPKDSPGALSTQTNGSCYLHAALNCVGNNEALRVALLDALEPRMIDYDASTVQYTKSAFSDGMFQTDKAYLQSILDKWKSIGSVAMESEQKHRAVRDTLLSLVLRTYGTTYHAENLVQDLNMQAFYNIVGSRYDVVLEKYTEERLKGKEDLGDIHGSDLAAQVLNESADEGFGVHALRMLLGNSGVREHVSTNDTTREKEQAWFEFKDGLHVFLCSNGEEFPSRPPLEATGVMQYKLSDAMYGHEVAYVRKSNGETFVLDSNKKAPTSVGDIKPDTQSIVGPRSWAVVLARADHAGGAYRTTSWSTTGHAALVDRSRPVASGRRALQAASRTNSYAAELQCLECLLLAAILAERPEPEDARQRAALSAALAHVFPGHLRQHGGGPGAWAAMAALFATTVLAAIMA
jgi:hypothetical protein